MPVPVVNVGYRSTNFWVVGGGPSRLLLDLGYPGTMGVLKANLARMGVPLSEIRYGLATHYHMDHAGLAEELKGLGVQLVVLEEQRSALLALNAFMNRRDSFVDITSHGNTLLTLRDSRAFLERIGLAGEILHTPGHSDDSVSLLLDDGSAFTGDLTHPKVLGEVEAAAGARRSWDLLRARGAMRVFPGHGPVHPLAPPSGD